MPPVGNDGSTELSWTLADGKRVSLSEQRGKVVVLDLYATWCQPCRQSIPHLISLHDRYKTKGLALVGLNVGGPDDRVKVADFAAEFHITYPLGFPDKSLSDLLLAGDVSIPQTFVFSRDGRLIKRYIGYDNSMPAHLEQLIQAELVVNSK
jgi:peroxiredoxin